MTVADCKVTVVLTRAPNYQVKVTNPAAIAVKVISPATKVVTIPTGARGPAGADGADGPAGADGADGASGTSRTTKAGIIAAVSFVGSPRKYSVVFATPFPDATYVLAVTGIDSRSWTYEAKTANGFTINANAAAALAGEVSWTAMVAGET